MSNGVSATAQHGDRPAPREPRTSPTSSAARGGLLPRAVERGAQFCAPRQHAPG
ncbi:hypothetical protein [Halorussus salinisoli]|uniref:hypothetical protein n=1 Tax=Halorussus salinisoli TaxID=2558242 RepID=UPI001484F13A|nr:hypothetical protein [Halorussus salinisoli]